MKPDPPVSFSPAANKKKIRTQKLRLRTAKEKKERIWGKTPQKPYISSSLGDMTRVMMRYACMENTYFYNTEPPPVEFYDYWQKFAVEQPKLPSDFVDKKRASIANIKKNTSSFDFFGTFTQPIHSRQDLGDAGAGQKQKRGGGFTSDNQDISDLWKDVRISMSSESFISSSTKISESASAIGLEGGWDDACSEDYQSSESDYGLDVQDKCRHHRHRQHYLWAMGLDSQAHQADTKRKSSLEFHTAQGLIDKQTNAIQQAMLALQKKDNRIVYELATQPHDSDIIDHFADDIDDSFLLDSYSYSELPDEAFGPDYDFLNEDVLNLKKVKREKKATGKKRKGKKSKKGSLGDDSDEDDRVKTSSAAGSKANSCVNSTDEMCQKKRPPSSSRRSRKTSKTKPGSGREQDGDESAIQAGGYDACMERRRRRIEEVLKAAVRSRSPMGSYRPKEGEEPLSRYKEQTSPGPAAYCPQINGTKANVHTAFLVPRWTKNIYETLGPGPSTYVATPKCTCKMITLHESPRFTEEDTIGPGPGEYDLTGYHGTAKGKPRANIVSRKNKERPDSGAPYKNLYGWTRYGKANPPNPLILGNNDPPPKLAPGPGEYDPKDVDRRVGITIKSRLPGAENEKQPGFLNLPDLMGTGPGVPIGIRDFMVRKSQSPGPIYQIIPSKPHGISLTFKPFPMRGAEIEPSPLEWGTRPGDGKIKTLPRAPEPYLMGKLKILGEKYQTPGPNAYDICLEECDVCTEPGATLAGRYPTKKDTGPGPGQYDPIDVFRKPPTAVFQHKKEEKEKTDSRRYVGGAPPKDHVVGGLITPRWRSKESAKGGAEMRNLFGFTNRGKKGGIPISLKSRHTPFKYAHIADAKMIPYDNSACHIKS